MTARSFNARNGLSVGTTPTEVVDASGNITTDTLTATTGNITTLNVSGDLTVSGTTTYINTTTLNVGDNIVTLNADFTTGSPTENAGIEIRRGSSANTALRWNESSDVWEITQDGTNYGRIHSKLTDIVLGTDTSGNYVSAVTSGTTALSVSGTAGEGWSPNLTIRAATTAVDGIVQLTDSVSSTSVSTAATPNSVKTAYDVAFGRVSSVNLATTANTVANKGILSITPSTGGGAGTRDDVFFVGSGTTTVSSNSLQITISSADQYTGTVTSVGSGNGLTGGAITTAGTLSVVAGNEMVVNASGVHHSDITRTNTTTGNTTLGYSGAFDVVDSITTNARGHVTGVNTKRVTLPASDNTDTTYDLVSVANTAANAGRVRLTASTLANDDILFVGSGTTVVSSNASQVTIATSDQYTGTVTSVGSGNGLTGGAITGSGTLSVLAGTGIVANATGVHIGQAVDTTSGVTFANVTIQNNATFGILTQTASGNSIQSTANITFTSNTGASAFYITSSATNAGDSSPQIVVRTGNATGTGSPGNITIQPGSKQYQTGSLLILKGSEQTNTTSGTGGRINIYGGEHTGGGGGGTDVYGGSVFIAGGAVSNATVQATNKRPGSVYIDGGTSSNSTGLVAPSIYIGTSATLSNVVIGSATSGNTIIYANGSVGTAGQVLHSNGTSTYWATDDNSGGTVTSVATGNGLTGGPVTTTGTISVQAGSGIVSNATGVHVNAGNGLVANATGIHMPNVATAGSRTGGISAITIDAQGRVTSVSGSAGYVTSSGVTSVATANGIGGGTITGTGTLYAVTGATLVSNTTGIHMPNVATAGSSTGGISAITIDAQGRVTSVSGSAGYVTSSGVTSVATGNGLTGGTITTTGTVSINAKTGLLANSSGLYVNASSIAIGTVPTARLPSGTTAASGIVQLTDSVASTSTTTAATPNSVKTAYDLAASKGTGTVTSVSGGSGLTGSVTTSGSLAVGAGVGITVNADDVAVRANTGLVANSTGLHVNSAYISSISAITKYAALRYSYTYDYATQYNPGTGFSYSSSGAKNISSLTWNNDGDITINFTSAFADANYKAFLQAPGDATHAYTGIKSQTTTSCRATTKYTANSTGGQFFINPGYTHNFVALEFA